MNRFTRFGKYISDKIKSFFAETVDVLRGLTDPLTAFTTIWHWALILNAYPIYLWASSYVNPDGFFVKLFTAFGTFVFAWAAPALIQKIARYAADPWKDKAMIFKDKDSGAKQVARVYLGRTRPHILLAPIYFFLGKWKFIVGEMDMVTGGISVTDMFVSVLVTQEGQYREVNTNEVIPREAGIHLRAIASGEVPPYINPEKRELTIKAAQLFLKYGIDYKTDVPL